jgi:predicted acyl esterase
MPFWLIPALKAVLPHVGTILSAASPAFTKNSAAAAANQTVLLQQQITELQAAASENDAHIKALAAQVQNAVEALEKGVSLAERRHQRLLVSCIAAAAMSVTSLCTAVFILVAR